MDDVKVALIVTRIFAKIKTIFKPVWEPVQAPIANSKYYFTHKENI
jgi:hypothetical protein